MKKILLQKLALLACIVTACSNDDSNSTGKISIAPFRIENDTTISLDGVINRKTLDAFNEALRLNPNTTLLIFKEAPGSEDDETNVQVGRKLFDEGLNTVVEPGGFIASGAVDLYLAGRNRRLEEGSRVGVHSWSDGKNEASDYPKNSEEHQLFIKYYTDVGMTQQLAEDFYFFTINAASADDIHWMTESELGRYSIETP